MQKLGVDLEQEYCATGFLVVTLERDIKTRIIEMKQTGLIQRIIEAVVLNDGILKSKFTPSDAKPLVKDESGEPASGILSYSSFIGMLIYLYGHTRPYFFLDLNRCACYMFSTKLSHGLVLKILVHYLK